MRVAVVDVDVAAEAEEMVKTIAIVLRITQAV